MCFSFELIKELLIWLVIIVAIVALVRLVLVPIAAPVAPWGGVLVQALNILLWAVIAIAVIVVVFDLISCLLLGLPRIR
jgi:hypothetical protein